MLNFLKKIFGSNDDYEKKFLTVVNKFLSSNDPYDVKVGSIMTASHNLKFTVNDIDGVLNDPTLDRAKFKDSLIRFQAELG